MEFYWNPWSTHHFDRSAMDPMGAFVNRWFLKPPWPWNAPPGCTALAEFRKAPRPANRGHREAEY